jgi:tetratricopeptide (TPR) repeat protein
MAMKKRITTTAFRASAMLAASLVLGSTFGCHRDPNVQKQKYLESGKRYANEGKYKEAAIQFANALKVDHNFAEAHYQLSQAYLKSGAMMPAYAELMRTVDLDPTNLKARIDLGDLLLAGGQPDRAAQQANTVLAAQINNADAHALLSSIAASKGERTTALNEIQQALAIDSTKSSYHAALGMLQSGDPASAPSAEEQLHKAVELDSKNVSAHLLLSSLLEKKGDIPGALAQAQAAVTAETKSPAARGSLVGVYLRQGNKATAEDTVRKAADELSDNPEAAQMPRLFYSQTGQDSRAESTYADLVSKHPKSTPLRLTYARVLVANHNIPKARSVVSDLIKTDGNDPEVAVLNGMFLLNDGKSSEAVDVLQKASKSYPDNIPAKIWLARAALAKGDAQLAQQSFVDATRLNPRNMEAQAGLAQIAISKQDYSLLAQAADATIAFAPQYATPYVWRGMAEQSQKLTDKANADYQQALKLDPKNSDAYLQLGQIQMLQKHIPEATKLLEQSLANNPGSTRALALLVSLDLYSKQPAHAIARIQDQIAKSPNNSEFYDQLSQVQLATGDSSSAADSAAKAMQLNPRDNAAVMVYTHAQLAKGDPSKAVSTWQQWTQAHPTDAQAFAILGTLEEAQGDKDKAADNYKKSLQLQPEQPVATNNLAYLMIESGQNIDVALSLAQTARRLLPNSASTADTLGWAYYQKASYLSARDVLEEGLKTAPDNAALHYHLGMTYNKLADRTNATMHLRKAANLAPNSQIAKDAQKALTSLT